MKKDEIIDLGRRIKAKRIQDGLTQAELATRLKIGFSTLQALEIGASKAVGPKLRNIALQYIGGQNASVFSATGIIEQILDIVAEEKFYDSVKQIEDILGVSHRQAIECVIKTKLNIK